VEAENSCHVSGDVSSEVSNLCSDVVQVGVAGPATQLFDDVVIITCQFEAHGSARTQAMGSNAS
jgi:hypothetical protein